MTAVREFIYGGPDTLATRVGYACGRLTSVGLVVFILGSALAYWLTV